MIQCDQELNWNFSIKEKPQMLVYNFFVILFGRHGKPEFTGVNLEDRSHTMFSVPIPLQEKYDLRKGWFVLTAIDHGYILEYFESENHPYSQDEEARSSQRALLKIIGGNFVGNNTVLKFEFPTSAKIKIFLYNVDIYNQERHSQNYVLDLVEEITNIAKEHAQKANQPG